MGKTYTNSGKSVKERLLNLSKAEHYNPQMMISRYMQERLLYRLSISNYRERFILKKRTSNALSKKYAMLTVFLTVPVMTLIR